MTDKNVCPTPAPTFAAPSAPLFSETISAAVQSSPAVVDEFATLISAELSQGILRQSQRSALIREAGRIGIQAFEANLLIAVVEGRSKPATHEPFTLSPKSGRTLGVWLLAAALLAIEAAVLLRLAT